MCMSVGSVKRVRVWIKERVRMRGPRFNGKVLSKVTYARYLQRDKITT